MNAYHIIVITLIVLVLWCAISVPAYMISALMTLGGNKISKLLLIFCAPVLLFVYGASYINEFRRKIKKKKLTTTTE